MIVVKSSSKSAQAHRCCPADGFYSPQQFAEIRPELRARLAGLQRGGQAHDDGHDLGGDAETWSRYVVFISPGIG